jgi:hypothetical protein
MKNVLTKLWTEHPPMLALIATSLMLLSFSGIIFNIVQLIKL